MCANMCKMDAKKICKSFKKLITVLNNMQVPCVCCQEQQRSDVTASITSPLFQMVTGVYTKELYRHD